MFRFAQHDLYSLLQDVDTMIFADLELSRRLERTEGSGCVDHAKAHRKVDPASGAEWREIAGTFVVFDGAESPITQTFGLGLYEEATTSALDEIEDFYRERGSAVHHEVSPFAGLRPLGLLCDRGYRPEELSSVMYQPIQAPSGKEDAKIQVRPISTGEAEVWADVSARGWADEAPELEQFVRDLGAVMTTREHSVCFLAEIDGIPGAAGALTISDGVALFAGASTIPAMRRRGLQGALLRERMKYAQDHGCDLAMMVAHPGTNSQRNAERSGFRVAYTRTKWKK
jgi:GNAT superfamily N-acetyltransferase